MTGTDAARGSVRGVTLVLVVVGVVVGVAFAPQAWGYATEPDGTVAVVELHGSITGDSASAVVDDLREARQNDSVQAVVLDVDSPGGTASASEQLYLAVKRTAGEMPVVASVTGTAASGSYYAAAPADDIYVTPASVVGSIGVRATLPSGGLPAGEVVTGPDKGSGSTPDEVRQRVETLRRAFVGSVFAERGDRIELTREEVSHAKVYAGANGVQNGLADEIGGIDTAISAAADDAGLSDYDVVRMEAPQPSVLSQLGLATDGESADATTEQVFEYRGVDTVQYLMLHGTIETDAAANETGVTANASA
ncbi:S49 family peptidase [Halobacterium sp. NMX12-1]|uniref:S49 family peptidase n=1 Tax=Halobacterium sp. NMX12-1 TaxID=3166650 RepID=A0AAU8C912_9EURY